MAQAPGFPFESQYVTAETRGLIGRTTDCRAQKMAQQKCTDPAMRHDSDVTPGRCSQHVAHRGNNSVLGVHCAFPSSHALLRVSEKCIGHCFEFRFCQVTGG